MLTSSFVPILLYICLWYKILLIKTCVRHVYMGSLEFSDFVFDEISAYLNLAI